MASEEDKVRSEAAIAAPGTVVLGDRSLIIRPPSVGDFGALRKELRRQIQASMADPIETANRKISEAEKAGRPLSPTMAKLMADAAFSAATAGTKIEPSDAQIAEQSCTLEGIRWWAWYLLRRADPTLTLKAVAELTPTEDEAFALANQIAEVSALRGMAPNS